MVPSLYHQPGARCPYWELNVAGSAPGTMAMMLAREGMGARHQGTHPPASQPPNTQMLQRPVMRTRRQL